ncbi:MAG: hypothetical protein R3B13_11595 [Polyangiaceae bacterium]
MLWRQFPSCLVLVLGTAIACDRVVGVDGDFEEVTGCEAFGNTCLAPPPADWSGPGILFDDLNTVTTCPSVFPDPPEPGQILGTSMSASAPKCECACDPSDKAKCDNLQVFSNESGCPAQGTPIFTAKEGVCALVGAVGSPAVSFKAPLVLKGCTPREAHDIAPPAWKQPALLCTRQFAGSACADGICAPPIPAEAQVCVYKVGDEACPAGPYSVRTLYYTHVTDERACSACTCGNAAETCTGGVEYYISTLCTGTPDASASISSCKAPPPAGTHALYKATLPDNLTCSPSASTASGDAKADGPLTVCCQK